MRNTHFPGRSPVYSLNGMVSTSHPLASKASADVLSKGGNAIDAAVTAAAVLAVVEPHSTGVGGDLFCLFHQARNNKIIAMNASGRAPNSISIDKLENLGIKDSIPFQSPHSVSIPTGVAGWVKLIQDHGNLELKEILEPAINYAEHGYIVADVIADVWKREIEKLSSDHDCKNVFLPEGNYLNAGDIHYQPRLAETLKSVAEHGRAGFYEGDIAKSMVKKLNSLGGFHNLEDFANAQANYVDPISANYRDAKVFECPPNGQGIIALMIMKILEGFDFTDLEPNSSLRIHLQAEATKLAYSHRDHYLADPDYANVPVEQILSEEYIKDLRSLIKIDSCIKDYKPELPIHPNTVYISVVDKDRNSVSLINSIFHSFGSGIVDPYTGVLFQNRGASFVLDPLHPNAIKGGKRPMHTIIPSIATKANKPYLSFGVMGGHYQPMGQAHVLSNIIDYDMDPQKSLDFPRSFYFDGVLECEQGIPHNVREELISKGHKIQICDLPHGGGQVIEHRGSKLIGGSDPRKDGCAIGL